MAGKNPRKPNAVLALIDAIIVRKQLKKQGIYNPGPAEMRLQGKGGTRGGQREDAR